ncbi:hypothetical protein LJB92_00830 [Bacteroidales bacterium OttesenSCG-928-M06]|nr:hypothetical protein [Bacteroidales bacterium OttesenSCG-928-M06]
MEIKHVNKQELHKKAKVFFHSQKWKNILVFFVFVILASVFWLMQYFQQEIEREISIPINYKNIPREIVLNDSIPHLISLKTIDKGTEFLKYYYNRKSLSIDIDLKDIPLNQNTYTLNRNHLIYEITDLLSNKTQLISFKPENIIIKYSPREKKELPVRINGKITPAPGYIFTDSLHIAPQSVWVYGEKTNLDTLAYISTLPILKENIQKDLNITMQLEQLAGTTLSTDLVNVSATIEEYTEKNFNLPIVCLDMPEFTNVRFFPSTIEVSCRIALSLYTQLTEEDLGIIVYYKDLQNNQGNTIDIELTQKPFWLLSYRLVPGTVEFLIEKN